ncbi:helix-turn-helix transcriptional regulator [Oceanobacillus sp. FSL W7-1293]|uniref:Helix-turn-helix domain-containing protein n=1 Tax=Oceanobacillus aidingensis TaxID=645964 RepID=A0ABV9JVF2_9BACI
MKKVNLKKIKDIRKNKGLSQEDMANLLGLKSLYPYHRKESGAQKFSAEEIHAIANYFDLPIEYFFDDELAINAI